MAIPDVKIFSRAACTGFFFLFFLLFSNTERPDYSLAGFATQRTGKTHLETLLLPCPAALELTPLSRHLTAWSKGLTSQRAIWAELSSLASPDPSSLYKLLAGTRR